MGLDDYKFVNSELLKIALTHPSAATDMQAESYERMEFLGDSILNASIADILYHQFPEYDEGQLSIVLANLVNSKTLAGIAKKLKIVDFIVLNHGEEQIGGRKNPNNLENALEAIIGAIYLDSNFMTVRSIIQKWWIHFFEDRNYLFRRDSKSILQELVQKKYGVLPEYKVEFVSGCPHEDRKSVV